MVQKLPPPPSLTSPELQSLNRWLLELQSILNNSGTIDPSQVVGLAETEAQVALNTSAIATLKSGQSSQGTQIAGLQTQVTANTSAISTINGQITTLSARNQVFNGTGAPSSGLGVNGDWYGDTAGAVGSRIWIKEAGAWVAFPF